MREKRCGDGPHGSNDGNTIHAGGGEWIKVVCGWTEWNELLGARLHGTWVRQAGGAGAPADQVVGSCGCPLPGVPPSPLAERDSNVVLNADAERACRRKWAPPLPLKKGGGDASVAGTCITSDHLLLGAPDTLAFWQNTLRDGRKPITEDTLCSSECFARGGVFLACWQNTFLGYLGISPDALANNPPLRESHSDPNGIRRHPFRSFAARSFVAG
jgi:hypothetical protein